LLMTSQVQPTPVAEESKDVEVDLLADTFAKFGLDMGSLFSGPTKVEEIKQASCRVQELLKTVPDYSFLTERKLYIDQLFP
jgi:hypothetical protein